MRSPTAWKRKIPQRALQGPIDSPIESLMSVQKIDLSEKNSFKRSSSVFFFSFG